MRKTVKRKNPRVRVPVAREGVTYARARIYIMRGSRRRGPWMGGTEPGLAGATQGCAKNARRAYCGLRQQVTG